VPAGPETISSEAILRACALRLPSYMVPKTIDIVDSLPTTPNGKVDYKALRAERMAQSQIPVAS
jgi:fatty-acyl-CoA synthase